MKNLNHTFATIIFILTMNFAFAVDYVTIANGNWNDPTIWSTDGGLTPCFCIPPQPTLGDNVTVYHNVTMTNHIGVSAGSTFAVAAGANLVGPGFNFQVWGPTSIVNVYGTVQVARLQNGLSSGLQGATLNVYGILSNTQTRLYAGTTNVEGYMYMPFGNFTNYSGASGSNFNVLNGGKLELFGGNINNDGNIFICATCCITTTGNWTNNHNVTGSGAATTTGGNMSNTSFFSNNITWCSAGSDSGMPTTEDCTTSTTTCGLVSLPVELAIFEGYAMENYNTITWMTATEENNDYFVLQRSPDGVNWIDIAEIDGRGSSQSETRYSYDDYTTEDFINYYRLEQVDYDGTSRFSAPISITNNGSGKLNLYPNPTTGDVLYIDGVENPNDIVMMNQFGQLVSNTAVSSISQNQVSMDVSQLRSGMYFIKDLNTLEQYKVIVP